MTFDEMCKVKLNNLDNYLEVLDSYSDRGYFESYSQISLCEILDLLKILVSELDKIKKVTKRKK